jgi:hypothetical protein
MPQDYRPILWHSVPLVIIAFALAANGYVQGMWSDRWKEPISWDPVVAPLKQVPTEVGAWTSLGRTDSEHVLPQGLGIISSLTRTYRNSVGSEVTLFIACGTVRDLLSHLPPGCYRANGDDPVGVEELQECSTGTGISRPFMTAVFVKPDARELTRQRIYWAWRDATSWQAEKSPQFGFGAGRPAYKVYFTTRTGRVDEGGAATVANPATDLIREMMPRLESLLGPAIEAS